MRKAFVGVVSLAILTAVIQTWAQAPQGQYSDPSQFHLAKTGVPIAGIPEEEALKIYERQAETLRQLPGAVSVSFMAEGLVVETANPSALPAVVEGLPVFAIPPVDPRAAPGGWVLPLPPPAPPLEPPVVHTEPPPVQCPPGTHAETAASRCRLDNPPPDPPGVELLPPPPGVIVLKPGNVREQADSCPEGFQEVKVYNNWRFCINPNKPEPIPPMMAPPIAGIPFEKALEIHNRHVEELSKLPGVDAVGLGADGIHVYTANPEVLPKEVEGVPIIPLPPIGPARFLSHAVYNQIRPLHSAVGIRDSSLGGSVTLTGVALSQGKPWLTFPSHALSACLNIAPCPPTLPPLNQCTHYNTQGQATMIQPVSPGSPTVGFAQRWAPLDPNIFDSQGHLIHASVPSPDIAVAYMDNDTIEGDGSLCRPKGRDLECFARCFVFRNCGPSCAKHYREGKDAFLLGGETRWVARV